MSVPYAQSYQGINGGLNIALPMHEIPDGQARWMQDVHLQVPGFVTRRGPLTDYLGTTSIASKNSGMAVAMTPDGANNVAIFGSSGHVYFESIDSPTGTWTDYTMVNSKYAPGYLTPDRWTVAAATALAGGSWIALMPGYSLNVGDISGGNRGSFFHWRGATQSGAITTTTTAACTRLQPTPSKTISLTDTTGLMGGHFVFTNAGAFVGVIASGSYTGGAGDITLENYTLEEIGNGDTLKFLPFRTPLYMQTQGRITITAAAPTIVAGTQGVDGCRFTSWANLASASSWRLYRQSDGAYIGTVTSITDDATLTLSGSAQFVMTDEAYFAMASYGYPPANGNLVGHVGLLTTTWGGRQWYANNAMSQYTQGVDATTRVWFSDPGVMDAVDLAADGDFFDLPNTGATSGPITGLFGISGGVLIFKEQETYMVTGTDASNFSLRKVADVGCASFETIKGYGNGVIWAGIDGIFYYDGARLQSLSQAMGTAWRNANANMNIKGYRWAAALYKDQYLLSTRGMFLNSADYIMREGASTIADTATHCFVVNMTSGAMTTFSNVYLTGSAKSTGVGGPFTVAATRLHTGSESHLLDISALFETSGNDTYASLGSVISPTTKPHVYIETKRYDFGDPERKKLFKQFTMNYKLTGGTMTMDTVPGPITETGTATTTPWATKSDFTNVRKKFTKRSTHIGLRFYEGTGVTYFKVGPHQFIYKLQRVGRV